MKPDIIPAFPEPLLAAMPQLSEKPRLGFTTRNQAWNPGFNVCNSTAALGLQFACSKTVSDPVESPNNVYANKPVQPPPGNFGACMAGQLIENFIGDEDKTGVTVAVHVGALLARQGAGSFLPGPGWLYTGTAIVWDVAMVGKSYVACKKPGE